MDCGIDQNRLSLASVFHINFGCILESLNTFSSRPMLFFDNILSLMLVSYLLNDMGIVKPIETDTISTLL